MTAVFRVAFVAGVTPTKWARIWDDRVKGTRLEVTPINEADQRAVLQDGRAQMCFVRLPIDRDGLHLIPLYREVPVVVAPKDHPVAAYAEVPLADLAGEHLLRAPDAGQYDKAIESVATGVGLAIVPMSIARLHHRKDLLYRPVLDVDESQIGLSWLESATDPLIETFIGIVRGRTERSSR